MAQSTLRYGMSGPEVKTLQSLLRARGAFDGTPTGNFKELTLAAVRYFQQTHVGPDGLYLKPDGVVGPATWWALEHPGEGQKTGLPNPSIPSGLTEDRKKVLQAAFSLYRKGVAETPKGSNWGDGVSEILKGIGAAPWCAYGVSHIWMAGLGVYPMGKRHGHCLTMWNEAKGRGKAHTIKSGYSPIPGDIFIMLYRNESRHLTGAGHTGIVTNVSADGSKFNTVAGNEGDRLKHGLRLISQPTLEGFINLLGDNPTKWKRQILSTETLDESLASTR